MWMVRQLEQVWMEEGGFCVDSGFSSVMWESSGHRPAHTHLILLRLINTKYHYLYYLNKQIRVEISSFINSWQRCELGQKNVIIREITVLLQYVLQCLTILWSLKSGYYKTRQEWRKESLKESSIIWHRASELARVQQQLSSRCGYHLLLRKHTPAARQMSNSPGTDNSMHMFSNEINSLCQ